MRYASPSASRLATSLSVMLLLGPRASCRIETWQASMLGRYLSIHNGWMARQTLLAPLFQIDAARLTVGADAGGVGQFRQLGGDQAGAELDAEARRIELRSYRPCRLPRRSCAPPRPAGSSGPSSCRLAAIFFLDEFLGVEIGISPAKRTGKPQVSNVVMG